MQSPPVKPPSRILALLGVCLLVASCVSPAVSGDDGWTDLYNGRDLTGWVQRGGKAEYRAEGTEIVGRAVPGTPNSFLCTTRSFTNFVLELEFRPVAGLNSGVQVRSHHFDRPTETEWNGRTYKTPAGRVHGYQIEIDPSARAWTGGLYEEGRRGWLQDLKDNEPARKAFRLGEWNRFRIECRGDHIRSWLNDVPAADHHDALNASGFIGLQVHGIGQRPGSDALEIRWRNIRIRELP